MKKLGWIGAFMLLLGAAFAQTPQTVTGTELGIPGTGCPGGTGGTNCYVNFRLRNYQGTSPRVVGSGALVPLQFQVIPNSSGAWTTTLYTNDVIQPNNCGTLSNQACTFYEVDFFAGGRQISSANWQLIGSGPFNLNTLAPLPGAPPPPPPFIAVVQNPLGEQIVSTYGLTLPWVDLPTTTPGNPASGCRLSYNGTTATFVNSSGGSCGGSGTITGATPNGGLVVTGSTLGLLTSCSSTQVLAWNGTAWACAANGGGGGVSGSGTSGLIPVWTGSTSLGNSDIQDNAGSSIILSSQGTPAALTGNTAVFATGAPSGACTSGVLTFPLVAYNQGCQTYRGIQSLSGSGTGTVITGSFFAQPSSSGPVLAIGVLGTVQPGNTAGANNIGVYGNCNINNAGVSLTNCRGGFFLGANAGTTTISSIEGLVAQSSVGGGSGTTTTDVSIHVLSPNLPSTFPGTMTHHYGILVDDQTAAGSGTNSDPWGIYVTAGGVAVGPHIFSTLPTCNSAHEGRMEAVSDATSATNGATISGSGTHHVLGYCNGSAWLVAVGN